MAQIEPVPLVEEYYDGAYRVVSGDEIPADIRKEIEFARTLPPMTEHRCGSANGRLYKVKWSAPIPVEPVSEAEAARKRAGQGNLFDDLTPQESATLDAVLENQKTGREANDETRAGLEEYEALKAAPFDGPDTLGAQVGKSDIGLGARGNPATVYVDVWTTGHTDGGGPRWTQISQPWPVAVSEKLKTLGYPLPPFVTVTENRSHYRIRFAPMSEWETTNLQNPPRGTPGDEGNKDGPREGFGAFHARRMTTGLPMSERERFGLRVEISKNLFPTFVTIANDGSSRELDNAGLTKWAAQMTVYAADALIAALENPPVVKTRGQVKEYIQNINTWAEPVNYDNLPADVLARALRKECGTFRHNGREYRITEVADGFE